MLASDVAGSWQVVEAAMAAGVEPADVYVEVLGPAMHGIGAGWQRGELGIEQEHLATGVALSIVADRDANSSAGVAAWARSSSRCRRVSGTVARRCWPDVLAQSGYEVLNLGADTPPASLARAVAAHDDLRAVIVTVVEPPPACPRLRGSSPRPAGSTADRR